jgi:hypothetical protein
VDAPLLPAVPGPCRGLEHTLLYIISAGLTHSSPCVPLEASVARSTLLPRRPAARRDVRTGWELPHIGDGSFGRFYYRPPLSSSRPLQPSTSPLDRRVPLCRRAHACIASALICWSPRLCSLRHLFPCVRSKRIPRGLGHAQVRPARWRVEL